MDMFLTGYHGTTLDCANSILESGMFTESNKDDEWLGKGIYFYFDIEEAIAWYDSPAILHSVIRIDNTEYLDINTPEGTRLFNDVVERISSLQSKKVSPSANVQQNQCAVMNMLWDSNPKLKVVSATFSRGKSNPLKVLLDLRPKRREFCVRSNDVIKSTHLIKRSDLYD